MKANQNNKKNIFLITILVVGTLLRLISLGSHPVSLNVDEVSIGYDAYSILKTGKDHFGTSFPLVFKSIGDYKNGLYIYLTALSIAIFGVNEFAIRFVSAIFGVIFIYIFFKLSQQLFKDSKIGYIATILITISPWHIRLSRGGYEANVALTLLYAGIYFMIKNLDTKKSLLIPSILLVLSAYSYHSEIIIVPLLLIIIFINYQKQILSNINKNKIHIIIISLITLPLLLNLTSKQPNRSTTVMANQDPEIIIISKQSQNYNQYKNIYLMAYSSARRYFQFFDPSFLFINGLQLTQHTNLNQGLFYFIEFPVFIIGLFLIINQRDNIFKQKKYFYLFIAILLISPIPAAITLNDYHIIRSYTIIFPFICLISLGLNLIINRKYIKILIIFLYFTSIFSFFDYYYIHFPKEREEWIFYPSKELALKIIENIPKYNKIIVDPKFGKLGPYTLGVPDIYVLFYGKFLSSESTKNIEYRHIEWENDKLIKNSLLIGSPWSLPEKDIPQNKILGKIYYNDGKTAYLEVENN